MCVSMCWVSGQLAELGFLFHMHSGDQILVVSLGGANQRPRTGSERVQEREHWLD